MEKQQSFHGLRIEKQPPTQGLMEKQQSFKQSTTRGLLERQQSFRSVAAEKQSSSRGMIEKQKPNIYLN